MFMKLRIIIPFVLCLLLTIGSVTAVFAMPTEPIITNRSEDSNKALYRLNEIADALYKAAYTNNRQAGFKYVQQLEKLLENSSLRQTGQVAGWKLMEESALSIESSLQNQRWGADWLSASARIQLTTDALFRPQHALWLQYEKVMLEDLRRVNQAWNRQTGDGAIAARASMNSFEAHLSRIEAAAAMQRSPERLKELKERLRYTNLLLEAGVRGQSKQDWTDDSIADLTFAVTRLFGEGIPINEEQAIAPIVTINPIRWTFLIGAIIMAVLTFTGWRKYKQTPYGVKKL